MLVFLSIVVLPTAIAFENIFYILRSHAPANIPTLQKAKTSLAQHISTIDLLITQAYQIDENGLVFGFIDPEVLALSHDKNLKLMALITNVAFDKERTHQFLTNPAAETRAIAAIVAACQKYHLYGVQFDFEMMPLQERDALTQFYRAATLALHQHGFIVSYAVAPVVVDTLPGSEFLKKIYENWEGVYDVKALGQMGDFISVMAYNQHGEGTTPGPTANIAWVEQAIAYLLPWVPAQKISLGIPSYSTYWFTGTSADHPTGKISVHMAGISYDQVKFLLQQYHTILQWDDHSKNHYAHYEHDWLNEYIFVEDQASFQAKLALVKKFHLRGISVFDLGSEDPAIWQTFK